MLKGSPEQIKMNMTKDKYGENRCHICDNIDHKYLGYTDYHNLEDCLEALILKIEMIEKEIKILKEE